MFTSALFQQHLSSIPTRGPHTGIGNLNTESGAACDTPRRWHASILLQVQHTKRVEHRVRHRTVAVAELQTKAASHPLHGGVTACPPGGGRHHALGVVDNHLRAQHGVHQVRVVPMHQPVRRSAAHPALEPCRGSVV